ncbi:helix-turn-helix domain-containing protein [Nocardia sp. R16R-3T]
MIEKWTGADVKALRNAMRLNQAEFAAISKRGVRTIGKWEQDGVTALLSPKSADVMDTLLDSLTREQAHRFHKSEPSSALAVVVPATADRTGLHSRFDDDLRMWVEMNRRELLQLFGGVAGGLPAVAAILAGLDANEQRRVGEVLVRPERVDDASIAHIEDALNIALTQNDLYGPQAVLPMVTAQQAIARALLAQAPERLKPRLLTVHSQLAQLAGWMQFDLRAFDLANASYEAARESAHEAGNDALVALVLCNLSYLSTWRGSPRTGIDHAVAAQVWARSVDDGLLRSYAEVIAAFAYASSGRANACLTALDAADDALVDGLGAESSVAYFHGPGLSLSFRSDCMYRIGRAADAHQAAVSSLELIGEGYTRNRAMAYVDLAHAHIESREIDEAAQVIGEAAGLAASCRSDRLSGIIAGARAELTPWQDALCVRNLDELMTDYGLSNSLT